MSRDPPSIHGVCVLLGEDGVLIRGPAGSGKSSLGRRLVAERRRGGGFARLVGDDRLLLAVAGGRLVARPHPTLVGLTEVRGLGIATVPHEPAAVVRLVVELGQEVARMPDADEHSMSLLGLVLPVVRTAMHDVPEAVEMTLSWQARHAPDWNSSN